jgi:myosin heavy subunit
VYTIGTFLEKNNDRLPEDMERFLATSTLQAVRELFPAVPTGGKAPPPARSICAKFSAQIKSLVLFIVLLPTI